MLTLILTWFIQAGQVCNAGCNLSHNSLNLSHDFFITLLPRNSGDQKPLNWHEDNLSMEGLKFQRYLTLFQQLHHQSLYWNSTSQALHWWPYSLSQEQSFVTCQLPAILCNTYRFKSESHKQNTIQSLPKLYEDWGKVLSTIYWMFTWKLLIQIWDECLNTFVLRKQQWKSIFLHSSKSFFRIDTTIVQNTTHYRSKLAISNRIHRNLHP